MKDGLFCGELIAFEPLPAYHNADDLANTIMNVLLVYGISEKVHSFTHDNASVNYSAMEKIELELRRRHPHHPFLKTEYSLGCLAHIINLAVNAYMDALNAPPAQNLEGFYDTLQSMAQEDAFSGMTTSFTDLLNKVGVWQVH